MPKNYRPEERAAIAQEIIDYLVERTRNGQGKGGKSFPEYSEKYKKIMGKDDPPDLTLSGEMLESITILNDKSGEVIIGFEKGEDVNGKAEGNILGSYGGTPRKSRARNFLDMTQSEINQILKNYPLKDRGARSDRVEGIKATGEVIREYLGYEADNEDE